MSLFRRLLALMILGGGAFVMYRFSKVNADLVEVDLLFSRVSDGPLWLVLLGTFVAGGLLTGLALAFSIVKQRLVARGFRKRVESLETEVHQLRTLPLAERDFGRASALEVTPVFSKEVTPQSPTGF